MYIELLLLLPCCMGILWALNYMTQMLRSSIKRTLFFIAVILATNYFCTAVFFCKSGEIVLPEICSTLFTFTGLSLIPLIVYYSRRARTSESMNFIWSLSAAPAIILTITSILLYFIRIQTETEIETTTLADRVLDINLNNKDTLQKLQIINNVYIYYITLILQVIWASYYFKKKATEDALTIKVVLGFFKGNIVPTKTVVLFSNIVLLIFIVAGEIGFGIIMKAHATWFAIIIDLISMYIMNIYFRIGLLTEFEYCTFDTMFKPYSYSQQEQLEMSQILQGEADGKTAYDNNYTKTLNAFKTQMEEELLFLNKDLTIEDLARYIGSNRTYVSLIANKEYNMTFREYINKKRVDYSKKYMQENPNDTQEMIADRCGFSSASSFNKKFTKLEKVSPRTWKEMNKLK